MMMKGRIGKDGFWALGGALTLGVFACTSGSSAHSSLAAGPFIVEKVISLGEPSSFLVEDDAEPDGVRIVERGSVLVALPADWDRSGPLELRLAWMVRDDFPAAEASAPRIRARGALVGAGDYLHTDWIHPDEEDLDQELILQVKVPDYGLGQGELPGHPYRGATSTLAMATVVIESTYLKPSDEFLALQIEAEWERWPMPGAVDGELLPLARARYIAQ
jgi:hypothetical protein